MGAGQRTLLLAALPFPSSGMGLHGPFTAPPPSIGCAWEKSKANCSPIPVTFADSKRITMP